PGSWAPFDSRTEFDFAYYHFVKLQSSAGEINQALDLWAAQVLRHGDYPPWRNAKDLYDTIDTIQHGDMPWKVYQITYTGVRPPVPPKWMTETYELCTRDSRLVLQQQLSTPDFKDKIDYSPYRQFDGEGKRVWSNLMSGDWAWKQADIIAEDPSTHGATFVPIVAGSDKTTVSVATGHQEYHPVWLAAIVQNWCPKCDAKPDNLDTRDARRRTHEKTDFLITCFDPGTLWDDFGIRSDVVPFTHDFPRADIHELLSPDLLHQVIKGTFKDHLVEWVNEYLHATHGEARALEIIADIDHRISAVPSFPGLRRFPDGRDFSQWTGDDSKALMKVYLAAIAGHVPPQMVKSMAAFMDFCYLARQNSLNSDALDHLQEALDRFH
ncbi:hypothetical protein C8R44DRAFT_545237, partial [Mycena epipterygia]